MIHLYEKAEVILKEALEEFQLLGEVNPRELPNLDLLRISGFLCLPPKADSTLRLSESLLWNSIFQRYLNTGKELDQEESQVWIYYLFLLSTCFVLLFFSNTEETINVSFMRKLYFSLTADDFVVFWNLFLRYRDGTEAQAVAEKGDEEDNTNTPPLEQ